MKRFLKRFEKLENILCSSSIKECTKISKRFERLEIGDKKIEVAITDKVTEQEKAPSEIVYYILCPYCGKENTVEAHVCEFCNHNLQSKLSENYQTIVHLLKKCSVCKAMNLKERTTCWVCGRNFFVNRGQEPALNTDNIITLNIDGKEYNSSDIKLPADVKALMQKIRRDGYKKEVVEDWINKRNEEKDLEKEINKRRLTEIRFGLTWRIIVLIVVIVFVIFWYRIYPNIMGRF